MKKPTLRLIFLVLIFSLVSGACLAVSGAPAARETAVRETAAPAAEKSASTPTEAPSATEVRATATRAPSAAPTETQAPVKQFQLQPTKSAGVSFDYAPIPFGQELQATIDGRKVSIKVNKVTTGAEADQIAFSKAPEEMQWAIVQLMIQYLDGEQGTRAQLLETSMFTGISKGNQDVGSPFLTYTPSPHLEDVLLLPGEQSLGYLAFQIYQDDPAPLLRFDLEGEEHFLALTTATTAAAEPEKDIQLALDAGMGTKDIPVPVGTPGYVETGGAVYKITVDKALRGFGALKKIKDGWGINDDPPEGKEFLMPYVSVTVARAEAVNTSFTLGSFSSFSQGSLLEQPTNFFCPLPCLQSTTLYPGGTVSGWIPLYAFQEDADPLLVFGGKVYFQIVSEQDTEMAYQRKFGPNAIGYPNREKLQPFLELQQVGPVNSIAFSPDDKTVITGGDDKTLHVWEVATGSELQTLKSHRGSVKKVVYSPDGALVASVSSIGEVIVWDTAAWEMVQNFDLKGPGVAVKFLPDGTLMGVNTGGLMQFWDAQSWQPVRQEFVPRNMSPSCASAAVQSFDSSDDGSILAASLSCGFSATWKMGSTKIIYADANRQEELRLRGKQVPNSSRIVLSPDGKMAAFGMVFYPNRSMSVLDILDIENQQVVAGVNPIDVNVIAVRVAPNKDLIMAGVGSQVIIWWPEAFVWGGKNLIKLNGHKVIVTALDYSTSGEILASGDYSGKTVLWRAK